MTPWWHCKRSPTLAMTEACNYERSVSYLSEQKRYEDAVLVDSPSNRHWSLYGIFDGHHGDQVARLLQATIAKEVAARLVPWNPSRIRTQQDYQYCEHVRRVLTGAFIAAALEVQSRAPQQRPQTCGSTATVVLQIGPLLTVANVGTTRCVLDVGHACVEMTTDDRLGNNEREDARLTAAGAHVARLKFDLSGPCGPTEVGCGPLRVWPEGLHMSRSFGDGDCAPSVIPHPHIKQVWLPSWACRVILATESVWEAFDTHHRAATLLRGVSNENAAGALLHKAAAKRPHREDMTVMVVDLVPEEQGLGFKDQMRQDYFSRKSQASDLSSSSSTASWLHHLSLPGSPQRFHKGSSDSKCSSSSGYGGAGAPAAANAANAATATITSSSSSSSWLSNTLASGTMRSIQLRKMVSAEQQHQGCVPSCTASSSLSSMEQQQRQRQQSGKEEGKEGHLLLGCLPMRGRAPPSGLTQAPSAKRASTRGRWTSQLSFSPTASAAGVDRSSGGSLGEGLLGPRVQVVAKVDSLEEYCGGYPGPLEQLKVLVDNQLLLHKLKTLGPQQQQQQQEEVQQQQQQQQQQGKQGCCERLDHTTMRDSSSPRLASVRLS